MRLDEFDYYLPEKLIAQEPLAQRDSSKLLVLNRDSNTIEHRQFHDIIEYLREGDLLVFNNTRVMPARLEGHKTTGGRVEVLLTVKKSPGVWSGIVKPGRRVGVGARLIFQNNLQAEVLDRTPESGRILKFSTTGDPDEEIFRQGSVPLPPYIHKKLEDPERYQTVFAQTEGSAAAPTAGLHFTDELLYKLQCRGVGTVFVTLHVGIATFRPVRTENIEDHEMHSEWFEIGPDCVKAIKECKGRIIAVGTTSVRALESGAVGNHLVRFVQDETKLFITPGYNFRVVDALITNFHVPKSSLMMMVSALAGETKKIRDAYAEAVKNEYRFLSFGDAMFIY